MVLHIQMIKRKHIRRLAFSGPFALWEVSFLIHGILSELSLPPDKISDQIPGVYVLAALLGIIPLIIFYNNAVELFYLIKFESQFLSKYPEEMDFEKFQSESDLAFPKYGIYIYGNDLFSLGPEYHLIHLDSVLTMAFSPVLFRVYHKWFLLLNTATGKKYIELNKSMDVSSGKISGEIAEPVASFIRDHFPEIECKGIV